MSVPIAGINQHFFFLTIAFFQLVYQNLSTTIILNGQS